MHDPDLPGLLKTEDFAAFSKKQVTYTDDLLVKIITNPKDPLISSDIVGTTLVSTSISLKEIADYFGAIAGFNEKEKARFINEVLTQRHSGALFERPFLRKNGVKYILTEGLRRLEQGAFPYDESTGEVSGLADIIADPQRFQFYARQIGLAIMGNNAEELNELSQIFKALTIVTQHNGIIELPLSDESD